MRGRRVFHRRTRHSSRVRVTVCTRRHLCINDRRLHYRRPQIHANTPAMQVRSQIIAKAVTAQIFLPHNRAVVCVAVVCAQCIHIDALFTAYNTRHSGHDYSINVAVCARITAAC